MDLVKFVTDNLISLLLSVVLLVIGLIFVPEKFTIKILKMIKPGLIDTIKKPLKIFINILTNLYLKNKIVDLNQGDNTFNEKTAYYLNQNDKIDKNIYVIRLCNDMIAMLGYVIPGTIGGVGFDVYEQAMYYLYHYSRIVEFLDQDRNFESNFQEKIAELRKYYNEAYVETNPSLQDAVKMMQETFIREILAYLKEEERKLMLLSENNKTEMIKLIQEGINGL